MRGNRLVMLALGAMLSLAASTVLASPVIDATKPAGQDVRSLPIVGQAQQVQPAVPQAMQPVSGAIRQLYERPAEVPQARVSKLGVIGEQRPRWMSFMSPSLVPRPG
jgi:hypothetical protein